MAPSSHLSLPGFCRGAGQPDGPCPTGGDQVGGEGSTATAEGWPGGNGDVGELILVKTWHTIRGAPW